MCQSVGNGDELRRGLRQATSKMLALEVKDPLQFSIIENLIDGPRSVAELVEAVYGVGKGQAGYMTSYTKTKRALDRLSSKGYVSRKLFGAVKPYRLTEYAFSRLSSFACGTSPPQFLPGIDRAVHLATLSLAIFMILSVSGRIELTSSFLTLLNSVFFFTLGLSIARIVQGIRRVL